MKIYPVVAELFLADRRTDITNLTVAFRNIANAPKKYKLPDPSQFSLACCYFLRLVSKCNLNTLLLKKPV